MSFTLKTKSIFKEASDEKQAKKQRCQGEYTEAAALRSLETHLGSADAVEEISMLVGKDLRSPVEYVEREIIAQDMNHQLGSQFW